MPCWFGEDDFLRVQVQKRRRSGLYAEYFAPVLSENQTSETVRYLVWVILVLAVLLTDSFHLLVDGSRVCGYASFVSGHDNFWLNSFFIYIYKIGTFPRVCP